MNKPQPQIIKIWRIMLTLASVLPAFLISIFLKIGSTVWVYSICGLVFFYLLIYLAYFPLLYKKMSYTISPDKIIYNTGAITTRVISVPVCEIQFTTVLQTIFARMFGLASIVVTLPGGRIIISGLKLDDANRIAELLRQIKD